MITLPRHLAPWAPQLGLFSEEIALALGPLVLQISRLIGAARSERDAGGAPDGYDGIARRGPYERLLASEWLIHDELPDEFLRRVVASEHSFLQRSFRHQTSARRTIALFDAGADQLGAPRIGQLAVLIVLAQRAERAGASLAWGMLHDPAMALRDDVTESTVRDLLNARCTQRVARFDIERWAPSDQLTNASELWLVGSDDLVAPAPGYNASVVAISDVLEPGNPQRIRVAVSATRGGRPKEVTLEIPEARAAVRLLRDPFGAAVAMRQAATARIDVRSNFVFSRDGRKLYVRGPGRSLVTIRIPNSPRGTVGPPSTFTPSEGQIIAVGQSWSGRRSTVVCELPDALVVYVLSKRGATATQAERIATDGKFAAPDDIPLHPLGALRDGHLCFIDSAGRFVQITDGKVSIKPPALAVAARATAAGFIYIERQRAAVTLNVARHDPAGGIVLTESGLDLPAGDDTRYFFSTSGLANVIAHMPGESRCTVLHRLQTKTLDVPPGHRVVGMIERGHPNVEAAAVAVDPSRTRIELVGKDSFETLLTTVSPISSAAVSDVAPVIAYITQAGELGIYSCWVGAMVLRVAAEAGA